MLRVASSSMMQSSKRSLAKAVSSTAISYKKSTAVAAVRFNSSLMSLQPSHSRQVCVNYNKNNSILMSHSSTMRKSIAARCLSSEGDGKKNESSNAESAQEEPMSQEIVRTPGQKVVDGTKSIMWLGVLGFGLVCGYFIVKELLPSKMSPNTVFNKAFEVVRENSDVKRKLGDSLKAYGRGGGRNEGRRNFIEHTEYTSQDDGSKRTRVRFNVEGQFGAAFVFAEVSSDMPSGEFVYILVQDKQTGRLTTIIDNRSALKISQMAGGSDKASKVFGNLLGGGSNK